MFLIEGQEADARELADSLPGWTLTAEQVVPLPNARPKVRRARKARG
jgi:hypothetical protein